MWVFATLVPATLWALDRFPHRRRVVWGACAAIAFFYLVAIIGAAAAPDAKPKGRELAASTSDSDVADVASEDPTSSLAPSATAAPTTVAPTTVPPTTTAPAPRETVSQRNARQKAADYLDFSAFSRSGLIHQLVFEGFTEQDSAYGVDALRPDWNEQAAKKAADYLDMGSFSRSGLIQQLVFEGFTQAQAEYGVGTTGL